MEFKTIGVNLTIFLGGWGVNCKIGAFFDTQQIFFFHCSKLFDDSYNEKLLYILCIIYYIKRIRLDGVFPLHFYYFIVLVIKRKF